MRVADAKLGNRLGLTCMLIKPQAKGVFDDTGDESGGLPRRQSLFSLTAKLGIEDFRREHKTAAFPDVIGSEFNATREQAAKLAKLSQRFEQAGAQARHVGAALRGRDEIHIAFGHDLAALRQPLHRPVYAFAVLAYRPRKRLCGQGLVFVGCLTQIVDKAVFETPLFALRLVF